VHGPLLVTYVHGLFESPTVARALFGNHEAPALDVTFDRLADAVERALDVEALNTIVSDTMRKRSSAVGTS
jgi:cobyric acid synthase